MTLSAAPYLSEARHFDALVERTGESWWGHQTPAGLCRLQRRAKLMTASLSLRLGDQVMEIAAGAGALTTAFLQECPWAQITATDISPESVALLRRRTERFAGVRAVQADITALEFRAEKFDAVIGNSALHHVDVAACLAELHRVLRRGGRLMVFEPNLLNPEVLLETTIARKFACRSLDYSANERTHTRWTYTRMLQQAGFADVCVTPFDFQHPLTPGFLVGAGAVLSRILERIPLVREFAGSLILTARKS